VKSLSEPKDVGTGILNCTCIVEMLCSIIAPISGYFN
jgi:hypothetical protein